MRDERREERETTTHLCLSLLDILRMWSGFTVSLGGEDRYYIGWQLWRVESLTWVSESWDWGGW